MNNTHLEAICLQSQLSVVSGSNGKHFVYLGPEVDRSMLHPTTSSLAASATCLALVCGFSFPSVWQLASTSIPKGRRSTSSPGHYEDEDGVATDESEATSSDLTQRVILLVIGALATAISLASAVFTSSRPNNPLTLEQWLQFVTWCLILFQSLVLFKAPSSIARYRLGVYGAGSCLLLGIALVTESVILWLSPAYPSPKRITLTLAIVQAAAAIMLSFANLLIPRRPDVFYDGKVVDRQNTVSLLIKFTFSWPTSIMQFVAAKKTLDYDDLPMVGNQERSKTLRMCFEGVGNKDKLWKSLYWSHKSAFIQQWVLELIGAVISFLPQIALYFLLRSLEARETGDDNALRAWLLVLCLGTATTVASWLDSWVLYIEYMKLSVPIFEQLSAVVFGKAIRKKDIKGVASEEDESASNEASSIEGNSVSNGEMRVEETDEADGNLQKTKQNTINLIGVDAERIADFATYNYLIVSSVIQLIISLVFLLKLIGWIPLLAAMAAPAIVAPDNIIASKRYSDAQEDLMKFRDRKVTVVTEAFQGIRQIKFSALEKDWYEKISQSRRKELKTQWRVFCLDTTLNSIWIFIPVFLGAISLSVYAIIEKRLTASVAFTTISLFEAMEMTLAGIPELFTETVDAIVSARRIQEYLDSPEREDSTYPGEDIAFGNATIAWASDDPDNNDDHFKLRNVNLAFPTGELSVISGKTGSGKSLLLSSIIGEAETLFGAVTVPRALSADERFDCKATQNNWCIKSLIAYVAQIPWIENASLRDNILFGLPMDESRYNKVLQACALEEDLKMLQDGDMTDIGANGINLSGGQKWRVSFARALYSRAGILVLDDLFSAVDAHVGRHLFEKALTGELGSGRTRILGTHHVALCLPRTKYSVLLDGGTVLQAGPTEELRRSGLLQNVLAENISKREEEDTSAVNYEGSLQKSLTTQSQRLRRRSTWSDGGSELSRLRSHVDDENATKATPKKFTEEEKRETGAIKLVNYKFYIKACGGFTYWGFIMLVFMLWIVVSLARSYWISVWTRDSGTESSFQHQLLQQKWNMLRRLGAELQSIEIDPKLKYFLGVYLGISVATWIVGTIRYFFVYLASIRASKTLFERMAFALLHAPLRWLDTTPTGRILNRFTTDFNMLDSDLAPDISYLLHQTMNVLSIVIATLFVSPFMIILATTLLLASLYFAQKDLVAAREVKRLESNARSPIFEQFGSVLTGISTIRASDKTDVYQKRMENKIDTHCQSNWYLWLFNRWLGYRLEMLGAGFVTAALIVSITSIDASLAGFALSFALELSDSITSLIREYGNLEIAMNAVERIADFSNINLESQEGSHAPAAWPTKGELEVNDLTVAYDPDLSPVLKGITFSVKENERIGVVGRTGAGKSSLTLALFRFLEARSGSIHIDGIDISQIKLYDLRSRLAIIPQDPVLFSGTVRKNLDPFDQHTDSELRDALARVHLLSTASTDPSGTTTPILPISMDSHPKSNASSNTNIFDSLRSRISEGGLNLSQGQRQLLCLARAIVSRPKIMVLDEATSSVDMATDALIQRSIREEFGGRSTLIVIAHRLSTIADFDRILVLDAGRVVEFDEPRNLMRIDGGAFRRMVEDSGERKALEHLIRG